MSRHQQLFVVRIMLSVLIMYSKCWISLGFLHHYRMMAPTTPMPRNFLSADGLLRLAHLGACLDLRRSFMAARFSGVAALGPFRFSLARRLFETSEWTAPDLTMQEAQICPAPFNLKYAGKSCTKLGKCDCMLDFVIRGVNGEFAW